MAALLDDIDSSVSGRSSSGRSSSGRSSSGRSLSGRPDGVGPVSGGPERESVPETSDCRDTSACASPSGCADSSDCVDAFDSGDRAGDLRSGGTSVTPAGAVTRRPISGSVHSWDLSTGVDGPGARFVTFLAGCPLACLYCQNPDMLRMRSGTRMAVDDLVAEADQYTTFIRAAGGGATISGGEPLLQPVFAGELFHRFKHELGLHTALDTSGFLGARATDALLRDVDLVLLDIKSWDRDTYRKVTGRPLEPTLDFARRLAGLGKEVHLRFVLVPGLTDHPANVDGVAAFAASLGNVSRVDVLPFHKLGEAKWQALGKPFTLHDTPSPTPAQVASAREIFASHGLRAV